MLQLLSIMPRFGMVVLMDFRGVMAIVFEIPLFFDSPCIKLGMFGKYRKFAARWAQKFSKLIEKHLR